MGTPELKIVRPSDGRRRRAAVIPPSIANASPGSIDSVQLLDFNKKEVPFSVGRVIFDRATGSVTVNLEGLVPKPGEFYRLRLRMNNGTTKIVDLK